MRLPNFEWDEEPQLNITPLVDVMLVLLAILMVAAPVVIYTEDIALPKGSAQVKFEPLKELRLAMRADGSVLIDGEIVSNEQLATRLAQAGAGEGRNRSVVIMADKGLRYEQVIELLTLAKRAGFTKVSLATDG
ncbi:MAG: biopolymer transporter ExbD [Campylobacterales bacterium]